MCSHAVQGWLELLTMEQYMPKFVKKGFDTIELCKLLAPTDLKLMGVENAMHRKLLADGVLLLINSPEQFGCREPCELHEAQTVTSFDSDEALDIIGTETPIDEQAVPVGSSPEPPALPIPQSLKKETCTLWTNDNELTIESKEENVPSVRVKVSYTCAVCPMQKFNSLLDLDLHIAQMNVYADDNGDGNGELKHRYGVPIIENYENILSPFEVIIVD